MIEGLLLNLIHVEQHFSSAQAFFITLVSMDKNIYCMSVIHMCLFLFRITVGLQWNVNKAEVKYVMENWLLQQTGVDAWGKPTCLI